MRVLQCKRILTEWRSDRRGVSAIEFAVVAPIAAMLVLGAFDFGNAAQEQIALQQAVADAGAYAMLHPTDFSGMTSAVTIAFSSATPSLQCGCMNSNTGAATASMFGCSAANFVSQCVSPSAGKLIYITATAPYTHVGSIFSNAIGNNTAEYVVRFQ